MADVCDSQLAWTGERYIPGHGGVRLGSEHEHRYHAVSSLARGKDVIDLGCGEGYGSSRLRETARSVVGVDLSPEAVEHAQRRYGGRDGPWFVQADACRIPLPDGSADLIVCFETLEHLEDHEAVMLEVERLLRPGGIFVVSTPDKHQYGLDHSTANEFHVHELHRHELETLLRSRFAAISVLGQRVASGSLLWRIGGTPLGDDGRPVLTLGGDGGTADELDPLYLVVVCARSEDALEQVCLGPWAFVDPGDAVIREWVEGSPESRELKGYLAHLDLELARARGQLEVHEAEVDDLRSQLERATEQLGVYESELIEARIAERDHHEHALALADQLHATEAMAEQLRAELGHEQDLLRRLQGARAIEFDRRWQRQRAVGLVGEMTRRDGARLARAILRRTRAAFVFLRAR